MSSHFFRGERTGELCVVGVVGVTGVSLKEILESLEEEGGAYFQKEAIVNGLYKPESNSPFKEGGLLAMGKRSFRGKSGAKLVKFFGEVFCLFPVDCTKPLLVTRSVCVCGRGRKAYRRPYKRLSSSSSSVVVSRNC